MSVLLLPVAASAQAVPAAKFAASNPLDAEGAGDRERAIACLALAIAHEAGHEPVDGQQAVAEVILNRLHHPGYPKSVCGVVFSGSHRRTGCQFTFTCDGSMKRRLSAAVVANTRMVATAALDRQNPSRVPGATHYHANYVSPYWAPSLVKVAQIGAHIFYRGAGARDRARQAYTPLAEPQMPGAMTGSGTAGPSAQPVLATRPTTVPKQSFAPWGLVSGQD